MHKTKKILAGALACATLAGAGTALAGCGSNNGSGEWVMKTADASISSGVYKYCLFYMYQNAMYTAADPTQPILQQKFTNHDGKEVSGEEYIKEEATEFAIPFLVADMRMKELGLSLDDTTRLNAKTSAAYDWQSYGEMLGQYGITQDDLQYVTYDYSAKYTKIFETIYGEGGEKEVSLDEMKDYIQKNYSDVQYLLISTAKTDGTTMSDEEIKDVKNTLDEYSKQFNEGKQTMEELEQAYITKYDPELTEATRRDDTAAEEDAESSAGYLIEDIGKVSADRYPEAFAKTVADLKDGSSKAVDLSAEGYICLIAKGDITKAVDKYLDSEDTETYKEHIFNLLVDMKGDEYTAEMQKLAEEFDMESLQINEKTYNLDLAALFEPSDETESESAEESGEPVEDGKDDGDDQLDEENQDVSETEDGKAEESEAE